MSFFDSLRKSDSPRLSLDEQIEGCEMAPLVPLKVSPTPELERIWRIERLRRKYGSPARKDGTLL